MRKEVSCRALLALLDEAQRMNIPLETVCRGVPYPLSHLRNRNERVEWDVFCTVIANLRPYLNDADFEALGLRTALSGPLLGSSSIVGRLLFSCFELYWWMCTSTKGPGSQLFACFTPSTEKVAENHLQVTLLLTPGHQFCREIFLLTKSGLVAIPTLIGLEPAKVEMRFVERGAVYDVIYKEGGGALSWLRKAVTQPFAARVIARELKEANEALLDRYAQLEEAQARIQHQAVQLQTAFSIGEVIRKDLNLDATIEAVAQALIDVAHFAAAEVAVNVEADGGRVSRSVTRGAGHPDARTLSLPLEARNQPIGNISVWLAPGTDPQEARELLDHVASNIAMEIDDALSFTMLAAYRDRDRLRQEEFSRQQIESEEAGRKRLAAELHDGLGQNLLVMNNELQQFMQDGRDDDGGLERTASILQETIEEVREIASNLHPHLLDRLGFCAAVEAMTDAVRHSSGLAIDHFCDGVDCLLPKELQIHVYRIVQEALSNVVRHAKATKATVLVKDTSGSVQVEVVDNGRGFTPGTDGGIHHPMTPARGMQGFGLSSMTERSRIIGGTLTIDSTPGRGTKITLTVPCA